MSLYPDFFPSFDRDPPNRGSGAASGGPLPQRIVALLKMAEVLESQTPRWWARRWMRASPATARQLEPFVASAEILATQVLTMIQEMKADLNRDALEKPKQAKKAKWRNKPRWREDQN